MIQNYCSLDIFPGSYPTFFLCHAGRRKIIFPLQYRYKGKEMLRKLKYGNNENISIEGQGKKKIYTKENRTFDVVLIG